MFTAIETPIHTDRTTVVEACAVKSRVSKPSARFSLETLSENVIYFAFSSFAGKIVLMLFRLVRNQWCLIKEIIQVLRF